MSRYVRPRARIPFPCPHIATQSNRLFCLLSISAVGGVGVGTETSPSPLPLPLPQRFDGVSAANEPKPSITRSTVTHTRTHRPHRTRALVVVQTPIRNGAASHITRGRSACAHPAPAPAPSNTRGDQRGHTSRLAVSASVSAAVPALGFEKPPRGSFFLFRGFLYSSTSPNSFLRTRL